MPNRCSNSVTIQAKPEVIKEIAKTITADGWFNNFFPAPKEIDVFKTPARPEFGENNKMFEARKARLKKLYGTDSWYDWRVEHRGSKRDVEAHITTNTDPDGNELFVIFESPRSPPVNALAKLTEKFDCVITEHCYEEHGMCFSGVNSYESGNIIELEVYDDPYFGNGKSCDECGIEYADDDECMWSEDNPNICVDCQELLDSKKE